MRPAHLALALPFALGFALAAAAADAELPRVEVAKLGKKASALVECSQGKAYGSAFCVHASGLFITNEHVVHNHAAIRLVLNAGQKDETVAAAKVVRVDADADLALLKLENGKDLPALSLGDADGLTELSEVVAFGFPFGTALASERKGFPEISVNVGSVTALRKKDGDLHTIQLDAVLNPGNSGGPVLDRQGKVVGVVVAGVRGAGVNFAIPVNRLKRFVNQPTVQFAAPPLPEAGPHAAATFEADVVGLLANDETWVVDLVITGADGKNRTVRMERVGRGTLFRAQAVPVPAPPGPVVLRAVVTQADGSITGKLADGAVKVGNRSLKLSDLRSLRGGAKPGVVLASGQRVDGPVTLPERFEVQVGKSKIPVDIADVIEVQLSGATPRPAFVDCAVVVRAGDREVGRAASPLVLAEDVQGTADEPTAVEAPLGGEDAVVRKLGESATALAVGGGGRYLVCHLPERRKLAVFDAYEAKVVKELPAPEGKVLIAAGATKLLVVSPEKKSVERWDLTTFEKEATAPLDLKVPAVAVAMGAASAGPLMVTACDWPWMGDHAVYDIQTLRKLQWPQDRPNILPTDPNMILRASSDGRLFVNFGHRGTHTCAFDGEAVRVRAVGNFGKSVPAPDDVLYTERGRFSAEGKEIPGVRDRCVPAVDGPYFLSVTGGDRPQLTLRGTGDGEPLLTLKDVDGLEIGDDKALPLDLRVHLVSRSKLLVTMPARGDRLILHRVDPEKALEKADRDYVVVTSQPPTTAVRGKGWVYPIRVRSRKPDVSYALESGPSGMAVNARGIVTWTVPATGTERDAPVVVRISTASGYSYNHRFTVAIQAAEEK